MALEVAHEDSVERPRVIRGFGLRLEQGRCRNEFWSLNAGVINGQRVTNGFEEVRGTPHGGESPMRLPNNLPQGNENTFSGEEYPVLRLDVQMSNQKVAERTGVMIPVPLRAMGPVRGATPGGSHHPRTIGRLLECSQLKAPSLLELPGPLALPAKRPGLVKLAPLQASGKILLGYPMITKRVWIEVAFSMAQGRPIPIRIPQMVGYFRIRGLIHTF